MHIGIDAFLLARPGGVGGYISSLLTALARYDRENRYTVYASPKAKTRYTTPGDRSRFSYVPLTDIRGYRILWQQSAMPRRLLKDGVELLHCPSYVAPVRSGVPIVLTLHDVIALKHPELCSKANAFHYRRVLPRAAKKAKIIIASSETTRQDILSHISVPSEKVRVIYPGIDSEFHPVEDKQQLESVRRINHLPKRFILFIGNIEPKKGLDTLVSAFSKMQKKSSVPHHLVIVGGALRGFDGLKRSIEKAGMQERVVFTGHLPRGDLPAIYSQADLFVFPSLYEGFGFPPLEAMACGAPVICSDGGSLPEVSGDGALIFKAGDANDLSAAIEKALNDDNLRNKLVEAGKARAKLFDWRTSVIRLLATYRDSLII